MKKHGSEERIGEWLRQPIESSLLFQVNEDIMMQSIFFQLTSSDSTDEAASNDHRDKCVVFSCPR